MNKLSPAQRAKVLQLLAEGMSIRAICRVLNVGKNTVARLLLTAGAACMDYQDRVLVDLNCTRIECDEIWSGVGSKEKNVPADKKHQGRGDAWTWLATCADSKLIPSWYIGTRDSEAAMIFMDDLAKRLSNRIQLSTDGHKAYLEAVEAAFGGGIDYGMLIKLYGAAPEGPQRRYSPAECTGTKKIRVEGNPDKSLVSTSYAERNNGIIRQHCKRYARLTLAFSKKWENHEAAFALHVMYYNFIRIHGTHKLTPAMAAGVTSKLWEMSDLVAMIEAWEANQASQ